MTHSCMNWEYSACCCIIDGVPQLYSLGSRLTTLDRAFSFSTAAASDTMSPREADEEAWPVALHFAAAIFLPSGGSNLGRVSFNPFYVGCALPLP